MLQKAWMLLLVPLLLATIACGSVLEGVPGGVEEKGVDEVAPVVGPEVEQESQPAEVQQEEPVQEHQEQSESVPKLSPDVIQETLAVENFEQFDSYIATMIVEMDGRNTNNSHPVNLQMQLNMQGQREPEMVEIDLDINAVGMHGTRELPGGPGSLNMIATAEMLYIQAAGGEQDLCYTMPTDTGTADYNPEVLLFGAHEYFDSDVPAEILLVNPSEQVNGVNAAHYRAENVHDVSIEDMDIDVWVDVETDYVVKFIADGNGGFEIERGVFMKGTIYLEYNLVSVNQGVNALLPENCEELGQ